MKGLKGIVITSELLLALGAIIAAIVFFMVGSGMVGFQISQFFSFSETRVLTDLTNRIDRASGEPGLTKLQYNMPVGTYTLKAGGNSLNFKTPNSKLKKSKLYGLEISDTEVRDEEYICVTIENSSINIKGGECEGLGPSSNFCANLRCVNGVCQPEYGEDCKNPDCSCATACCPGVPSNKKDEKGCLKGDFFESGEEGEKCGNCPEICNSSLNCTPTSPDFDSFSGACCPDKTVWNGTKCGKLKEGEDCTEVNSDKWCEGSLKCIKTDSGFTGYNKACCPHGKKWNGTQCIVSYCEYPCVSGCKLPDSFDWRSADGPDNDNKKENWATPIKNQGLSCGSCWAFSAVGATEGTFNLEQKDSKADPDLSEQDLVSCSSAGSCSTGGWPHLAFNYMKNTGIVEEGCFPYQASDVACSKCSNAGSRQYSINSYSSVSGMDNIKRALICKGTLSVASMNWGHAITLVGYNDSSSVCQNKYGEDECWIIKNSWGIRSGWWIHPITGVQVWHENGYAYIPYSGHPYSDLKNYIYYVRNVKKP